MQKLKRLVIKKNILIVGLMSVIALVILSIVFYKIFGQKVVKKSASTLNECLLDKYIRQNSYTINGQKVITDIDDIGRVKLQIGYWNLSTNLPFDTSGGYSFDEKSQMVAYIKRFPEDYNEKILYKEVYLRNLKTKKDQTIFKMNEYTFPNQKDIESPFTRSITSINFSPDGTLLGITTTEEFVVYNIQTRQLTHELFKNLAMDNHFGEHGFSNPVFSQDNSQVLLNRYMYEGSNQYIFNRNTKEFKLLKDYVTYASEKHAIGFYDNKLVVEQSGIGDSSKIFITDPSNMKEVLIYESKGNNFRVMTGMSFKDGDLTFVAEQEFQNHILSCYNYAVGRIETLGMLNLRTGVVKEILKHDSSNFGNDFGTQIKNVSFAKMFGESSMFIYTRSENGGWGNIFLMDLANTSEVTELNLLNNN